MVVLLSPFSLLNIKTKTFLGPERSLCHYRIISGAHPFPLVIAHPGLHLPGSEQLVH